jgi:hypothetical protein
MKILAALSIAAIAIAACANPPAPETATAMAPGAVTAPAAPTPLEISAASFRCIRDMKAVRGFYVDNLLGDIDATIAAANSGGTMSYPAGSIVQLVPGEAMVKHHPGYNAATNDWEFFELDTPATGAAIRVRGATEVVNQFGGNCLSCHVKAESKWDMICEQGHGCDPLPLSAAMTRAIQNTDPRCGAMELPDDQKAALQQLAAFRQAAAAAAAQKPAGN